MIQFQWPPPDVTHEGSPGLMPGGRSAGLMYRRKRVPYLALPGGILPDLSQGGEGGPLPCDLSHYAFDVTYPCKETDASLAGAKNLDSLSSINEIEEKFYNL